MQQGIIFLAMNHVLIIFHLTTLVVAIPNKPTDQAEVDFWNDIARKSLRRKFQQNSILARVSRPPKNIILLIGDGMGTTVVTSARAYRNQKENRPYLHDPLFFETFPHTGFVKTHSYNFHTTDSAAAATSMYTGRKVDQNTLGLKPGYATNCDDPTGIIKDNIADLAIANGIDVGFVTTTPITHATPAALYAKGVNRYYEQTANSSKCKGISEQLLEEPANKFKVMLAGGTAKLTPSSMLGDRLDHREITEEWKALDGKRQVVFDLDELNNVRSDNTDYVMGVFAKQGFSYHLDRNEQDRKHQPRLVDMASKAVEILSKNKYSKSQPKSSRSNEKGNFANNGKGYFLMLEGGLIDSAQHTNQMRYALEETLEFDLAIEKIYNQTNPDETLIIVTADHSHAVSLVGYLEKEKSIFDGSMTSQQYDNVITSGIIFAAGPGGVRRNYTKEEFERPDFKQPSAVEASLGYHGGEDVGIWATGPYSWLFTGTMENTEIGYYMKMLLCTNGPELNICDRNRKGFPAGLLKDKKEQNS